MIIRPWELSLALLLLLAALAAIWFFPDLSDRYQPPAPPPHYTGVNSHA